MNSLNGTTTRTQRAATLLRYLRERPGQALVINEVADALGMPRSSVYTIVARWLTTPELRLSRPGRGMVQCGGTTGKDPDPDSKTPGTWELIEHIGVTSTGRALIRTEAGTVFILERLR
jgi:IclR helix-turn-helix domain